MKATTVRNISTVMIFGFLTMNILSRVFQLDVAQGMAMMAIVTGLMGAALILMENVGSKEQAKDFFVFPTVMVGIQIIVNPVPRQQMAWAM